MKKPKYNLANNPFYRKWSNARDLAAEVLLDNSKKRNTEATDKTFTRVLEIIHTRYKSIKGFAGIPSKDQIERLNNDLHDLFNTFLLDIYNITIDLRVKSYMLSKVAEIKALSLIFKIDKPKVNVGRADLDKLKNDKDLLKNLAKSVNKLRHKIIQSVEQSVFQDETLEQAVGRVFKVLPKREQMSTVRKLKRLVKVKEAAQKPSDFIMGSDAISFTNQGRLSDWNFDKVTWDRFLDDYEKEFLIMDRSPASVIDIKNPFNDEPIRDSIPSNEAIYGWEVEQETTNDFVQAVRSGENNAAKENGIDDFIWIAILDKKTCEQCCEWRDGLTTTQIQEKLEADPGLADYCDAITAPAHFSCRCRMAPYSSELEPFEPETDLELDTWLQSLE